MFSVKQIEKLLFIDIETASVTGQFQNLDSTMQSFWEKKARQYYKVEPEQNFDVANSYLEKAGLFSEFNRVVCVSAGYIQWVEGKPSGCITSFCGTDEKEILLQTLELLNKTKSSDYRLCGHNIKEFDCPVLARRMLINGIHPLPSSLNNYGKKPWDVNHVDTMELWKFGDFKNYTALALLCHLFDIPNPKTDVDGSQINNLFWEKGAIEEIAKYCERDVEATMNLILRFSGIELLHKTISK